MAHSVSPRASNDLDEIWFYVARDSGSVEIADRLINSITDRFFLLANHPYAGRKRYDDLGIGKRSFPVGEFLIVYRVEYGDVFILRVVHGRRDLGVLFDE